MDANGSLPETVRPARSQVNYNGSSIGGLTSFARARIVTVGMALVVDDIDPDHSEAVLRESEERLALAIEVGQLASWDWDLRAGHVTWNDRHFF